MAVMARIDYNRAAVIYDQGRAHPLHVFAEWRDRLAENLVPGADGPVLDVGAGTGIWSDAFTTWFGLPVVALEPAAGMRAAARTKGLSPAVMLVAGHGEALPLREDTCQAAWLSTVIHHVADLGACAAELRRVLQPRAPVLIRSSFPGRHDEIPLFRFFPAASRVAQTFPTVEQTVAAFEPAGYQLTVLERVNERREGTMMDWVNRVQAMRHADSTLAPLSDADFASGLEALKRAAADGQRVPETGLDLVVLRPTTERKARL
jgi:ubiquinone/menaquinone biosynthesis C-methylase UbiE